MWSKDKYSQPGWTYWKSRPVAGTIPWRPERKVAHASSLLPFASLYMADSLQTGSNPESRGEDTHMHPQTCSLLETIMLQVLNSHLSKPNSSTKQAFSPNGRTPSPAERQVVWQHETGCGCRLCTWLPFVPLVCGFQGATVVQWQKRKERRERN